MKKIGGLIILLFIFAETVFAETDNPEWKRWNESKLSWDDFQDTTRIKGVSSSLYSWLGFEIRREKKENLLTVRPVAYAYIDRSKSHINPGEQSEELLRFYQLNFDLLEVYRRRLQRELNTGLTSSDAEAHYRSYLRLYEEQQKRMDFDTARGANLKKLEEWEKYVAEELRNNESPKTPVFQPRGFGYGFVIGAGATFPTGEIADRFTPAFQFGLGLDFSYRRVHLLLDISGGEAWNRRDMWVSYKGGESFWMKKQATSYTLLSASIGYETIDTKHFSLTPFAGVGGSRYSNVLETGDKTQSNVSLDALSVILGLNFDYRFSSIASIVPSFWLGHREMFTSSLRTRVFVSYGDYEPGMKGYQIGISLNYSGFGRMIKIR